MLILSETNPFVVNTSYNRIEFSESLFNGTRSFSTPGVWAVFSASLSMAWNGQQCVLSFSCLSKVIILFFSFFWHSRGTLRIKIQFDILLIENTSNIHICTRKAKYELKSSRHRYKLWIQVNTIPVYKCEWSKFSIYR